MFLKSLSRISFSDLFLESLAPVSFPSLFLECMFLKYLAPPNLRNRRVYPRKNRPRMTVRSGDYCKKPAVLQKSLSEAEETGARDLRRRIEKHAV